MNEEKFKVGDVVELKGNYTNGFGFNVRSIEEGGTIFVNWYCKQECIIKKEDFYPDQLEIKKVD